MGAAGRGGDQPQPRPGDPGSRDQTSSPRTPVGRTHGVGRRGAVPGRWPGARDCRGPGRHCHQTGHRALYPSVSVEDAGGPKPTAFGRVIDRIRLGRGVKIQGVDGLVVRYAQCCQPVPGDPVVGYVTQGRGHFHPPVRLSQPAVAQSRRPTGRDRLAGGRRRSVRRALGAEWRGSARPVRRHHVGYQQDRAPTFGAPRSRPRTGPSSVRFSSKWTTCPTSTKSSRPSVGSRASPRLNGGKFPATDRSPLHPIDRHESFRPPEKRRT